MMLVAHTVHIILVEGPYLVDRINNDAKTTERMLKSKTENMEDRFE